MDEQMGGRMAAQSCPDFPEIRVCCHLVVEIAIAAFAAGMLSFFSQVNNGYLPSTGPGGHASLSEISREHPTSWLGLLALLCGAWCYFKSEARLHLGNIHPVFTLCHILFQVQGTEWRTRKTLMEPTQTKRLGNERESQ